MEVTDAIEHAETELSTTLEELAMHKELVAALEQDAKRIRLELLGLKSYANRQGLTAVREPSADVVPISADVDMGVGDTSDLSMLSRSEAVATVMAAAAGPLDRAAIHELFADGGRFDSIDEISLSLSGLKRSGRAERLGQGMWRLVDAPNIRNDFAVTP